MKFLSIDELVDAVNRASREKNSCLFGLDFEVENGFFVPNPLEQKEILFDFNGVGNFPSSTHQSHIDYHFEATRIPFEEYTQKFEKIIRGLQRGDSFLTNLTIRTPLSTSLSLYEMATAANAKYRLYLPNQFVCFSPEQFVRIEKGYITTRPMKGTIRATEENATTQILNDEKERAEHYTIVDLLRNDLSRVAENVNVKRFRYLDRLHTDRGDILQVSSEIIGQLEEKYLTNLGHLLLELLPAGSVSGAPKKATLQMIREAEGEKRGFYTGVAGYFDGENLDMAVLIRYVEQRGENFYFRSGGGITAKSDCEKEYQEVIQKIYLPIR